MRRAVHPFLALLLALLLVGSQQAALAHMLGHAVAATAARHAVAMAQDEDADHGAALSLAHACTTCIAFAGVDAAPPITALQSPFAANRAAAPEVTVSPASTFRFGAAFRSRAPPLL